MWFLFLLYIQNKRMIALSCIYELTSKDHAWERERERDRMVCVWDIQLVDTIGDHTAHNPILEWSYSLCISNKREKNDNCDGIYDYEVIYKDWIVVEKRILLCFSSFSKTSFIRLKCLNSHHSLPSHMSIVIKGITIFFFFPFW